ncbi:MAG: hypothetical protein KBI47_17890 [Armatimonadetes bacterium]|jgi:hypothetical protein|nr:hypothetical protein [Armatimonadota bacterium]MDI9583913.1 hypothetical protein [Acidobacteriota bacterium]
MRNLSAVLMLAVSFACLWRSGADPISTAAQAQTPPAGPPSNGLVVSLLLSSDAKHIYAGALPIDLVMTNVTQSDVPVHPLPHLTGDFTEYIPVLLLFDSDGRGLYPHDVGQWMKPPGMYSGPGPQPPVLLAPGKSVLYWFSELLGVCTELGLPAGRYVAQVVAPRLYAEDPRTPPGVLVSNLLAFDWPGPVE